jgi:RNA polymerase sigma-70 factor (ECF subfamily)
MFLTTRWSVVLAAAGDDSRGKEEALAVLCGDYWKPVYAYIRRRGHDIEEARDLTQEFFARLLEKDWLSSLTREGGGFRGFLLTMLKRFLVSEHRRDTAAKRGGTQQRLSLDVVGELPEPASHDETPEQAFDRRWALTVLDRAVSRLRDETSASGKLDLFTALVPFLSGEPAAGTYDGMAPQLGMNAPAIAMAVRRLRLRFRDHVRAEVAETLADPAQAEHEMKELLAALRRAR